MVDTGGAVRSLALALLIATALSGVLQAQAPARRVPATGTKPKPAAAPPAASAGLTNQDIVKMVQAGLGEAVLLAAVRSARITLFDLSPDALIALKKEGVSDAVVAAMIDPKATVAPAAVAAAPVTSASTSVEPRARIESATASPEVARDPGIYWDKGRDGAHDLVALEPTVFSQAKTGGILKSSLTMGIAKVKVKAVTRGSAAVLHVAERKPIFYFYFESKASGLGSSGGFSGWLAAATSPNEFVLARMTSRAKDRELIVGEVGALGASQGARSKDTIDIQIAKLSGGVYRVSTVEALEVGEYCFFFAGGISSLGAGAAGRLFDFGIY